MDRLFEVFTLPMRPQIPYAMSTVKYLADQLCQLSLCAGFRMISIVTPVALSVIAS